MFCFKIDLVNYKYSGNKHDVIAGIGLVDLLWYSSFWRKTAAGYVATNMKDPTCDIKKIIDAR